MNNEQGTKNKEQWTMNNEQGTMNKKQWTMNNEQWTMNGIHFYNIQVQHKHDFTSSNDVNNK